jgi:hypothetical protein
MTVLTTRKMNDEQDRNCFGWNMLEVGWVPGAQTTVHKVRANQKAPAQSKLHKECTCTHRESKQRSALMGTLIVEVRALF